MRILHVIPELKKGGAERIVLDSCNELQGMGHDVALVTFRNENEYNFLSKDIKHMIIPSLVQFSLRKKDVYQVEELQAFIESFAPDVIHSHLFETECVLSGIVYPTARYFVHFHNNMPQFKRPGLASLFNRKEAANAYERKQILKSYAKRNVSCIAISQDTLNYIHANLPSDIPSTLLHNAIHVKRFANDIAWEDREKNIAMIGSLLPNKNHKLAISILNELHLEGLKYNLHIIGDGNTKEELLAFTESLRLTQFVHFHGKIDHPEEYLKKAQFLIHTALKEAFGLVLIEAMAAGCIVISKDGGGNRDLIANKKNGIILDENIPRVYAREIADIVNNEALRTSMINAAKETSTKYDISNYCLNLTELYTK